MSKTKEPTKVTSLKPVPETEPAKVEEQVTPPAPEPSPKEDEQKQTAEPAVKVEKTTAAAINAAAKAHANPEKAVLFMSPDLSLRVPVVANGKSFVPCLDNSKKFVVWAVDKDSAKFFEKHTLVMHGRIIKAD